MNPNAARRPEQSHVLPIFSAPYAAPDEELAAALLAAAPREAAAEARIDARAMGLVEAIRARFGGLGGIQAFFRGDSLSPRGGPPPVGPGRATLSGTEFPHDGPPVQ